MRFFLSSALLLLTSLTVLAVNTYDTTIDYFNDANTRLNSLRGSGYRVPRINCFHSCDTDPACRTMIWMYSPGGDHSCYLFSITPFFNSPNDQSPSDYHYRTFNYYKRQKGSIIARINTGAGTRPDSNGNILDSPGICVGEACVCGTQVINSAGNECITTPESICKANSVCFSSRQAQVEEVNAIRLSQTTVVNSISQARLATYNSIGDFSPTAVDAYNGAALTAANAAYAQAYTGCVASAAQRQTTITAFGASLVDPLLDSSIRAAADAASLAIATAALAAQGLDRSCSASNAPIKAALSGTQTQAILDALLNELSA